MNADERAAQVAGQIANEAVVDEGLLIGWRYSMALAQPIIAAAIRAAEADAYRAGLEAAALGSFEPLPTGRELLDYWLRQLPKAERAILKLLADNWPDGLSKDAVAALTGYEVSGGGFNNALGKLRTLELITGSKELRASDELFGE